MKVLSTGFLFLCLFFSFGSSAQSAFITREDSVQAPNSIFMKVDRVPEFPGGSDKLVNFILQHAHVPPDTSGLPPVTGKVYVQFIVEKDGSLSNIKIIKGIGSKYEQECTRVFGIMPKWAPGKIGKHNVRTLMMIPITIS